MKRNNIVFGIFILLVGILAYIIVSLYSDNKHLTNEVNRRDALLVSALNQDSIWIHKQDSIIKNVERETVFYMGNKQMSGEEFLTHMNALLSRYYELEDSLQYYKQYYSMVQSRLHTDFGYEESLDTINQKKRYLYHVSYDSIVPIPRKEVEDWEYKISILNHLVKKYQFRIDKHPNFFVVHAEAIDSAMMLLPYFRDNIKYSQKDKCWIITH